MNLKDYAKGRKPYSRVYILYDSLPVNYLLKARLSRQKGQRLPEVSTGIDLKWACGPFLGDGHVLKLDCGNSCITIYIC